MSDIGASYIDRIAVDIYQEAEGSGLPGPHDAPLYRMYAVLALAKGVETTLADVHDAWAAWCGTDRPKHPSRVLFNELTPEVQAMDQLYVNAIHRVAQSLEGWDKGR